MNGHAVLRLAEALATVAHEGQSRKGAGEPYVEHPKRVAENVLGWEAKSVAWLHDVVEDTHITLEILEQLFPPHIVAAVDLLTFDNETDVQRLGYLDHIRAMIAEPAPTPDRVYLNEQRVARSLARLVKIADIKDNLRDLDELPGDYQGMRRRYERALQILEFGDDQ